MQIDFGSSAFLACLCIVVSLVTFPFFGMQNLSFGPLGPSTLAPGDHFGSLGTLCGTMGAAGQIHGVQIQIFNDFGVMSGLHFKSFLGPDELNYVCFSVLVPGHVLHRFLNRNVESWSLKQGVRMEIIAKIMFSQRSCFHDSG